MTRESEPYRKARQRDTGGGVQNGQQRLIGAAVVFLRDLSWPDDRRRYTGQGHEAEQARKELRQVRAATYNRTFENAPG